MKFTGPSSISSYLALIFKGLYYLGIIYLIGITISFLFGWLDYSGWENPIASLQLTGQELDLTIKPLPLHIATETTEVSSWLIIALIYFNFGFFCLSMRYLSNLFSAFSKSSLFIPEVIGRAKKISRFCLITVIAIITMTMFKTKLIHEYLILTILIIVSTFFLYLLTEVLEKGSVLQEDVDLTV